MGRGRWEGGHGCGSGHDQIHLQVLLEMDTMLLLYIYTWGNNDKWVWSEGRYGRPKGSLRSVLVE